ncbi:MAG: PilW family protein [Pseudomonadota bacterium]|jgi:prepilin-type N-terminal cleavage/methylation domain|nr:MAG: hypothetical protein DIU56_05105 [Pseudomonadota bacterium]
MSNRFAHRLRARRAGFSLVELMVAMAIGSLIVVGAVYVYSQTRTSYTLNETTARLQEEARYVLSLIEPDVQLAGYYGFTNSYADFQAEDGGSLVPASQLQQEDPPFAALPASAQACGNNFAVDLMATVQGSNNGFQLGPGAALPGEGSGCAVATPVATADTLTIRRASTVATAPSANRLQLYVNRIKQSGHRIMTNGVAPGPVVAGTQEVRDLVVRTYYVARDSEGRPGVPALRMITLGPGPAFEDVEIMPGVEDLQVQFGIDTGDYDNDGVIDLDADNNGIPDAPNGIATRYVNADSTLLPGAQVVSVRLWLRLRADQPEGGFQDDRNYVYADVNYTPAGAESAFRRVLVSRTIQLRNARTL